MAKRTAAAHLVTRAEMARRLGVSKAAVTQACRPGGHLAPACEGTKVNALHEAARKWVARRAALTAELPPLSTPIAVDEPPAAEPERERPWMPGEFEPLPIGGQRQISDLDSLSEPLTTLTEQYGDAPAFERWIRCRRTLEEARKAEMLRARIEGRLIARTTVIRMVDHVDVAFRLLLADAPRTIATRLSAPDTAAATAMIRDVMSQALEAARDHMASALDADDEMAPLMEAAE